MSHKPLKIALFASTDTGLKVCDIFRERGRPIDFLVISDREEPQMRNAIVRAARCDNIFLASELGKKASTSFNCDLGLLAWWPTLITPHVLRMSRLGFLNFHPSLLPHNRGKHPNFWAIVDEAPFGVSIHWVDETIDGGDIAFQEEIGKDWTDTGKTLYLKSKERIIELFSKNFDRIVAGDIPHIKQPPAPIRYVRDLDPASRIDLEKNYRARDFLNLLRARTFEPHPGCYFFDGKNRYEARVEIKRADQLETPSIPK